MTIKNFVAPALPLPPQQYDPISAVDQIRVLRLYFNQLDNFLAIISTPQSGATLDRPTQQLQVGQIYFDTDLGIPIFYNGTDWVDAAGNVV